MESLSRVLNDAVVRRLADKGSHQRGYDYYRNGHVSSLEVRAGGVDAVVHGSRIYTVTLFPNQGALDYACDCPMGEEGEFCKHCVAVALVYLDCQTALAKTKPSRTVKKVTLADAAKVLRDEDPDTLVKMIVDWAKEDDRLHERLLSYAASQSGPGKRVAAVARAISQALDVDDFVDYYGAWEWANSVGSAIDQIDLLLQDGLAGAAIPLCESAIEKLDAASESVDDSDGEIGGLQERLEDLHFQACQLAPPDPVALAKRLLDFELNGGLDVFHGAVERYKEILGDKGLQEYRRLAEKEWKKVPVRTGKPGDSDWSHHFEITQIMESLAKATGDVEQLVSVMSRDLSHAYSYLKIAEVYREAKRPDQALHWAEKGLKAFPEKTDSRLREFAANEYHRLKRHDDAMKLAWAEFSERIYLDTYRNLEQHAKKAGNWPEWRSRALAEIRNHIANAQAEPRTRSTGWPHPVRDHSQLVEILLYEKDTDAAWREGLIGGCTDALWLKLAAAREADHPADAAPIYMKQAEASLKRTTDGRYEGPVALLGKAAAVMKRMGQSEEFVRYLDSLRVQYKIKRNFIKLLEKRRKSLYLS